MVLAGICLGLIISQALDGKTLAGRRVAFAPVDPIDLFERDAAIPAIAVYVGEATGVGPAAKQINIPSDVNVVVHVILPPTIAFDGAMVGLNSLTNRSGGEALLIGLICRQIGGALGADLSEWGRLFNGWCSHYKMVTARPIIIEEEKHQGRYPALELLLNCRVIADPPFGKPLEPALPWNKFLVAMTALGGTHAQVADCIRALIEGPANLSPYRQLLAALGLGWTGAHNLGLSPHVDPPPVDGSDSANPLTNVNWLAP